MSHTPGPWRKQLSRDGKTISIFGSDGERVADVAADDVAEERAAANAAIISAAPELLEAVYHLKRCGHCAEEPLESCDGGRAALEAIRKAEGR